VEYNFDDGPGVFDFEELAGLMLDQGLQTSPSAVHGCLCGLLSAGASHQQEYCLDALVGALETLGAKRFAFTSYRGSVSQPQISIS